MKNLMLFPANTYRPFSFEWAHDAFLLQQSMHWIPDEIDFSVDKKDYYEKLSDMERAIISRTLLFFTQMDVEVGQCYTDLFIPYFKNLEIRRMLLSFANMEQIHAQAYNQLLQELDLPLDLDESFLEIKAMSDKNDYLQEIKSVIANNNNDNSESNMLIARAICIISGAIEGFVLYSSFAVLFYFSSERSEISSPCLMGVGTVIEWSIRDETHHSRSMIRLCLEFCERANIDIKQLQEYVHNEFTKLVELEDNFIDYILKDGDLVNLKAASLKKYVRYLANFRLRQLKMDPIFKNENEEVILKNPLAYMSDILKVDEHTNFFDSVPTAYKKSVDFGDMEEAFTENIVK